MRIVKLKHLAPFIGFVLSIGCALILFLRSILLFISLHLTAQNIQTFIASSNYHDEEQQILAQMQHPFQQLVSHYQLNIWLTGASVLVLLVCFFYYIIAFYQPNASNKMVLKKIALYISLIVLVLIVLALFFQPQLQNYLEQTQQLDLLTRTKPTYFSFTHVTNATQNGLMVKFPATDYALFQANRLSIHQWTFLLLGVISVVWLFLIVWIFALGLCFTSLRKKSRNLMPQLHLTSLPNHPNKKTPHNS